MSNLLEKLQATQKESKFVAKPEQDIAVTIIDIKPTKNDDRVMIVTKEIGNQFAFRNCFDGGVPVAPEPFKAVITLRENGEFVNISRVKYNLEAIGKYSFVATNKLTVSL